MNNIVDCELDQAYFIGTAPEFANYQQPASYDAKDGKLN